MISWGWDTHRQHCASAPEAAEPFHLFPSRLFFVVRYLQPKQGEARLERGRRYGPAPQGGRESGVPPGGAAAQETPLSGPPRASRVGRRVGAVRRSHGGAGWWRELAACGRRAEDGPAEVRARAGCGNAARRALRRLRPGPGRASAGIWESGAAEARGCGPRSSVWVERATCGGSFRLCAGWVRKRGVASGSGVGFPCAARGVAKGRTRFWFDFAVYGQPSRGARAERCSVPPRQ